MSDVFTWKEVQEALNRAADDVLDAIGAPEGGKRDLVNLVVNAAVHYLREPEATLDDAVRASYDPDVRVQVLGWCRGE